MYKQIIKGNSDVLASHMAPKVDKVIDFLVNVRVISPTERDDINQSTTDPKTRSDLLLQLIVNYGQNALETLFTAVLEAELYTVADILSPINSPHHNLAEGATPSAVTPYHVEDEYEPEQEAEGNNEENLENKDEPLEENLQRRTIQVQKVPPNSRMYKNYIYSLSPGGQRLYYTMKQVIRGRAVIIDNENFQFNPMFNKDGPCKRYGTSEDRENMSQLFKQLSFFVVTHKDKPAKNKANASDRRLWKTFISAPEGPEIFNQTTTGTTSVDTLRWQLRRGMEHYGFVPSVMSRFLILFYSSMVPVRLRVIKDHLDLFQDMMDIVRKESLHDHKDFDCFVLIILSHGKKGEIYGTDWCPVKVNHVKKTVCGTRSLFGKPKLIFVQACRGDESDHGVKVGSDHGNTGSDFDRETDQSPDDRDGLSDGEHDDEDEEEGGQPNRSTPNIPSDADVFLAMATVSGRPAWRDLRRGSWFIQAIVDVFQNNAHRNGLPMLMIKVTDQLSRRETEANEIQVSETILTFRKTLCFFPGLHSGATATS